MLTPLRATPPRLERDFGSDGETERERELEREREREREPERERERERDSQFAHGLITQNDPATTICFVMLCLVRLPNLQAPELRLKKRMRARPDGFMN